MSDLLSITREWLLTDVSTLSILYKVVLDRFLRALPHDMKRAASLCVPQTLEGLLEAMENTEHSGPAEWEPCRVSDPCEESEGQLHCCGP
jgi:hypothetical protein